MENKNVIAVNIVGHTENQCVAGGGHQLPILQLHAEFDLTQNPISVIITEDFTVGANLVANLPNVDTLLYETDDINYRGVKHTIIVPAGVNVLKIVGSVYHENEGAVYLDVVSPSGKYWLSISDYEQGSDTRYIGVTPEKTYILTMTCDSETGTESASVSIYYSQSINQHATTINDY